MNPVFWFLLALLAVVTWFALRGLFVAVGKWVKRTMKNTKAILEDDGENKGDENNE